MTGLDRIGKAMAGEVSEMSCGLFLCGIINKWDGVGRRGLAVDGLAWAVK